VGFGNRFDDREAEAAALGGRLPCLAEPLEGLMEEVGWKALPLVQDVVRWCRSSDRP
jgi:hypothetical protein